jgi:hypothetical protein
MAFFLFQVHLETKAGKLAFFFFENLFFPLIFLLGYIYCTGGIHCDNSGYAYVYLG